MWHTQGTLRISTHICKKLYEAGSQGRAALVHIKPDILPTCDVAHAVGLNTALYKYEGGKKLNSAS